MCSCWLHAHLLSRDNCPTVRSVPLSVRTVCLTGLIIRVWRGLPDWRPFKCWILKCHFAACVAAAAAQALRRVSGAGNVIAHIFPPHSSPTFRLHSQPLFLSSLSLSLSFAFPAHSRKFCGSCATSTWIWHTKSTCSPHYPLPSLWSCHSASPFGCLIQKLLIFFCLMAFLCIANCRSACFQLGISMESPRETRQTQKDL